MKSECNEGRVRRRAPRVLWSSLTGLSLRPLESGARYTVEDFLHKAGYFK